jgi:catechol 2,3-dioxygenase-like lactoylglutathione lyase family enzyme
VAVEVQRQTKKRPTVSAFSHVSTPVRSVEETIRFWTEIFDAEPVMNNHPQSFAEVKLGGLIIGMSKQPTGWTGRTAEFPHYAFYIEPDDFAPVKERLEAYGVPTHAIWTRNRVEALMYFRDPSGNLFELYCKQGFPDVMTIPRGASAGGDYQVDLEALNYDSWKDPGKQL